MRSDLIAARGKITKISFFIHNFMDRGRLERERVEACAFMVVTADGPVSMCLHNGRRDDFLSKPIKISTQEGEIFWNPGTGRLQGSQQPSDIPPLRLRKRKGRAGRNRVRPTCSNDKV